MTKLTKIEGKKLISALNDFAEIQKKLISKFMSEFIKVSSQEINLRKQIRTETVMPFLLKPDLEKSLVTSEVFNRNVHPPQNSDLLGKPRKGTISALGEEWLFTRHGGGILFVGNESKRIVDAHREIFSHLSSFDAWRLSQYFESLDCLEVVWKSNTFATNDDDDLDKLLELLEQEHVLELASEKYRLYKLARQYLTS